MYIFSQGKEYRVQNVKDVLYFGEPLEISHGIIIEPVEFQNDFNLNIYLRFGGKKSPMKASEYTLSFENPRPSNWNELIVDSKENRLISEIHADLGTTRERILQNLLGR